MNIETTESKINDIIIRLDNAESRINLLSKELRNHARHSRVFGPRRNRKPLDLIAKTPLPEDKG